jgi:hypothetical protein
VGVSSATHSFGSGFAQTPSHTAHLIDTHTDSECGFAIIHTSVESTNTNTLATLESHRLPQGRGDRYRYMNIAQPTICVRHIVYVYTHIVYVYTHIVYVYTHIVYVYTHIVYVYTHIVYVYTHIPSTLPVSMSYIPGSKRLSALNPKP